MLRRIALEVPKTYAAARLAGDPDFTVRGAWGKGQIQKFFDRPGVAHTSFTVYTVPGDEHGSAGITMVEVVPPKVDLTNAAELLAALDTTSKDYATAFLVLASDELGVTWVQNTHPNRLDLLSENLSEGRRAVGIVGIEKKQPLGTGVRFHRILLDPAADNWTKSYLTTGCQVGFRPVVCSGVEQNSMETNARTEGLFFLNSDNTYGSSPFT